MIVNIITNPDRLVFFGCMLGGLALLLANIMACQCF